MRGAAPRGKMYASGSAYISGTAFAYPISAGGSGGINSKYRNPSVGTSSSSKSSSKSGSSSKASSAAKSTADSEKSEFEKAYAYHQHLLKMEQESEAEYLAWLEQAYKDAYAQQKIELDDYYKYEEECFEKRKSIFEDHLTDQEHQIWLYTDTMEGMEMAGVAVYEQMLKEIAAESNAARARGLDETDSYVQELQKKWRDYYNKAEELRQKPYNDSLNLQQKQLDYETKLRRQNTTKQVNIYKNMIATCEAAMRAGQARGLSETNEFMMQMAANVQEYANQIASTLQNAFSNFSGVISTVTSALSNFPQMSGTIQSLYNLDYSKSRSLLDYMTGAGSQYFSDTDRANQFAGALTKYFTAQDYQKQLKKNFNDALNGLIDKRASAIKESNQQARDAQADSLQDQLDALEEFYDKQIEMLQDEADYEDYLKNQKEKRKSIADIEAALAQLEADDSAAANKKKLKLRQELADKTADLDEFERDHARDAVIKQLEDERDEKTKALQDQLDAVRSYSESEVEIRQQATNDIMNMNEQQFAAFIQGLIDSGQMTEDEAKEMIENFLRVADAIGYAAEQLEWYQWAVDFSGYSGMDETAQYLANGATEYANKVGSNTGTPGDYKGKNQVVSTAKKSTALSAATTGYKEANDDWWNMKQTAGYKSGADKKWIDTKYQTEEDVSNALKAYANSASYTDDGATALLDRYINSGNAYEANKAKELKRLAGLATGTPNASPGIYRFDELGTEYYLSKDGNKYKMMSSGDKMLNAKATDFLYNFAIGKNSAIQELIERMSGANVGAGVESKVVAPIINMGDINVAGDASERTVSEIRRAQRDQMNFIIKEFNKYSR